MQTYYHSLPQRSISTYFQLVFYTSSRPKGHVRCLWAEGVVTVMMVLIPNWRATIRLLIILTSRTFRPGGLCQLLTRHWYHFNATMCISFVPDGDLHGRNVVRCSYLLRESLSTQLNSATLSTVMLVETVAEINPTEHNPIIGTQTHTYTWTHKYRVV